jgi:hypothetical protein
MVRANWKNWRMIMLLKKAVSPFLKPCSCLRSLHVLIRFSVGAFCHLRYAAYASHILVCTTNIHFRLIQEAQQVIQASKETIFHQRKLSSVLVVSDSNPIGAFSLCCYNLMGLLQIYKNDRCVTDAPRDLHLGNPDFQFQVDPSESIVHLGPEDGSAYHPPANSDSDDDDIDMIGSSDQDGVAPPSPPPHPLAPPTKKSKVDDIVHEGSPANSSSATSGESSAQLQPQDPSAPTPTPPAVITTTSAASAAPTRS